jgi:2-polyprenyl-3-methyl-5-hydroxy-6-metoxy-1,4-benzoquinol methylase
MQEKQIKPIAIPGIHARFYEYFRKTYGGSKSLKILEVGAGHGALTQKLWNDGYAVEACDLYPEIFYFKEIKCRKADLTEKLPYPSDSFDAIIGVEVMEHIHDHELFFKESHRLLKKNGRLMVSTPNILSLKSRVRFLFTGFFYSFKPLDHQNNDGLQHLASLTIDQYRS